MSSEPCAKGCSGDCGACQRRRLEKPLTDEEANAVRLRVANAQAEHWAAEVDRLRARNRKLVEACQAAQLYPDESATRRMLREALKENADE